MSASALVYIDLETTSLKKNAGITQISAVWRSKKFNCYVLPSGPVSHGAASITGIKKVGEVLFVDGTAVKSSSTHQALSAFIQWLSDLNIHKNDGPPILVSHNAKVFDIPRLLFNAKNCCLEKQLVNAVGGYIDSLPLFRSVYPSLAKHSQDFLLESFGLKNENPHNAMEDVRALRALMSKTGLFRKQSVLKQHFYQM